MSKLEVSAQPWLAPMIQGNRVLIPVEVQRLLARWAIKTATMFHYIFPAPFELPQDRLRTLRLSEDPPDDSAVWLAASASRVQPFQYHVANLKVKSPVITDDTDGELVTIAVGQLALQVLSCPAIMSRSFRVRPEVRPIQLWPSLGESLQWPPPALLDDFQLRALFARFTPDEPFPFEHPIP